MERPACGSVSGRSCLERKSCTSVRVKTCFDSAALLEIWFIEIEAGVCQDIWLTNESGLVVVAGELESAVPLFPPVLFLLSGVRLLDGVNRGEEHSGQGRSFWARVVLRKVTSCSAAWLMGAGHSYVQVCPEPAAREWSRLASARLYPRLGVSAGESLRRAAHGRGAAPLEACTFLLREESSIVSPRPSKLHSRGYHWWSSWSSYIFRKNPVSLLFHLKSLGHTWFHLENDVSKMLFKTSFAV